MSSKIKIELGHVQKTLFMPLWARAIETQKKEPILIDKTALEIIDKIDYDFNSLSNNLVELNLISWIARCKRYDEIINKFISNNPKSTIVNLGCGMDTTYERINNRNVLWYDLDLPDVIDLRRKFLQETDKRKFISKSLLDTSWFDDIKVEGALLIISAGVFTYIKEEEVKSFLISLVQRFPESEMLIDVTSSHGIRIANKIIMKTGLDEKSFMKWALNNENILLNWDKRIKLINIYYTYKIEGLKMSFKNKILSYISDSLKIQYMLHLRISK